MNVDCKHRRGSVNPWGFARPRSGADLADRSLDHYRDEQYPILIRLGEAQLGHRSPQ